MCSPLQHFSLKICEVTEDVAVRYLHFPLHIVITVRSVNTEGGADGKVPLRVATVSLRGYRRTRLEVAIDPAGGHDLARTYPSGVFAPDPLLALRRENAPLTPVLVN